MRSALLTPPSPSFEMMMTMLECLSFAILQSNRIKSISRQ